MPPDTTLRRSTAPPARKTAAAAVVRVEHSRASDRPPAPASAPAALLHRAVRAPAALTPRDVAVLQRSIGNRAVASLLTTGTRPQPNVARHAEGETRTLQGGVDRGRRSAGTGRRILRRSAPRVQARTAGEPALIQRAVGFEFETPWKIEHAPVLKQTGSNIITGLGALGGAAAGYLTGGLAGGVLFGAGTWLGSKAGRLYEDWAGLNYSDMSKYQVAHQGDGWKLTADTTPEGSVIEFVVDQVDETTTAAGANRLTAVMADLLNYTTALDALNNRARFPLSDATHRDGDRRYRISIGDHDINGILSGNPQTTAGVRLDRIGHLSQEVGAPGAARTQLMGMDAGVWGAGVARYYQHAQAQVAASMPALLQTPQLEGLVSLAASYIIEGAPGAGGESDQYAVEYAKAITILMARTNFAAMYNANSLAGARGHFAANAGSFVNLVMGAAMRENGRNWNVNARAGAAGLLLERSLFRNGQLYQPNQLANNITRRAWLEGIQAGADLSTRFDPSSMGKLGNRMDRVGPLQGEQGAILEFRKMGTHVPHTQWAALALRVYNYVSALNTFDPNVHAVPHY
jgi:hypothetical protein